MSVLRARSGGVSSRLLLKSVLLAGLSAGLGGCSVVSAQHTAALHAADPDAPVPAAGYRSVVAPYQGQRPVEPLPWGEQNQRVAPQPNR